MFASLSEIPGPQGFSIRGDSSAWPSGLDTLHVVSNLATFAALMAISAVLVSVVLRRKDVHSPKLYGALALSTLSCGAAHLVAAISIWHSWHLLADIIGLVTAIALWSSVVMLVPALPQAFASPGPIAIAERLSHEALIHQRNDALFESALQACPAGILLVDAAGKIRFANSLIVEWFGYQVDELLGQPIELLVPSEVGANICRSQDACSGERARAVDEEKLGVVGLTKTGEAIPIDIGLNSVAMRGGDQVLFSVINNSRRKQLEDSLIAKTNDVEQLMYIVSHDLRSPLVTIEGFAGMVGQHIETGQYDRATDDLTRITRATRTMARLIRDVMDLSRVNRQQMKLESIDVREVIEEVSVSLEGLLLQANAQLEVEEGLPMLLADRNQLLQVFLNLISNAVKYGCPRPDSTIRVGCTRVDNEIRLFVADEGPGVEVAHRQKIFEPFQRGVEIGEGSGLGLAIVYNVLKLHDGRVWVEPAIGGGAAFWIAFPAVAEIPVAGQIA